jgi:mRNA-degrading endonuclease RelE of RelBE toxin-antitoxin system
MSYKVESTESFKRQLKRLIKKYPSLKNETAILINTLEETPEYGTPIGKNCFKIRMAIASKGKGKSGGARVITHIYITRQTVYLLAVYDKSEQENIASSILETLLRQL